MLGFENIIGKLLMILIGVALIAGSMRFFYYFMKGFGITIGGSQKQIGPYPSSKLEKEPTYGQKRNLVIVVIATCILGAFCLYLSFFF